MIEVGAWTNVGLQRTRNEDAVALPGIVLTGSPLAPVVSRLAIPETQNGLLFAVVDGMGGHVGGVEASRLVAIGLADPIIAPEEQLRMLNDSLYDEMHRRPELEAMGATVVAVEVTDLAAEFFNVGDARGYSHVNGFSTLITTEDRTVPGSNEISQSLGGVAVRTDICVHRSTVVVEERTRLLLCSDGLSDCVRFSDIQDALDQPDVRTVCHELIGKALDAGAPDNISVVVIDHQGTGDLPHR